MPLDTGLREELAAAAPGRVRFNEPMRVHTSFHIGGPAEIWAEPQGPGQLTRLLGLAQEADLPVTVAGGGSNLLVRDEGIPGLVLHPAGHGFQSFRVQGDSVTAGAALPLEWLLRRTEESGLSGVEFLAGVPGHVGGAVRMNAGTHDEKGRLHHLGDVVVSVEIMERDGRTRTLPAEAVGFEYRTTRLDGAIVLAARLRLKPDSKSAIGERVRRLWAFKRQTQDWSAPSVGCIFKNPPTEVIPAFSRVIPAFSRVIPAKAGIVPSAGWMIDQAGLKGYRIGNAAFSSKHANFILNLGNASASDVLALIEEARVRVLRRFGVELELEVQILP